MRVSGAMMAFVDLIRMNVEQDVQMDISVMKKLVNVKGQNVKLIRTVILTNVVRQ